MNSSSLSSIRTGPDFLGVDEQMSTTLGVNMVLDKAFTLTLVSCVNSLRKGDDLTSCQLDNNGTKDWRLAMILASTYRLFHDTAQLNKVFKVGYCTFIPVNLFHQSIMVGEEAVIQLLLDSVINDRSSIEYDDPSPFVDVVPDALKVAVLEKSFQETSLERRLRIDLALARSVDVPLALRRPGSDDLTLPPDYKAQHPGDLWSLIVGGYGGQIIKVWDEAGQIGTIPALDNFFTIMSSIESGEVSRISHAFINCYQSSSRHYSSRIPSWNTIVSSIGLVIPKAVFQSIGALPHEIPALDGGVYSNKSHGVDFATCQALWCQGVGIDPLVGYKEKLLSLFFDDALIRGDVVGSIQSETNRRPKDSWINTVKWIQQFPLTEFSLKTQDLLKNNLPMLYLDQPLEEGQTSFMTRFLNRPDLFIPNGVFDEESIGNQIAAHGQELYWSGSLDRREFIKNFLEPVFQPHNIEFMNSALGHDGFRFAIEKLNLKKIDPELLKKEVVRYGQKCDRVVWLLDEYWHKNNGLDFSDNNSLSAWNDWVETSTPPMKSAHDVSFSRWKMDALLKAASSSPLPTTQNKQMKM